MKIVFIGDSITDANHNYSDDTLGEGFVKIVAGKLQEKGLNIECVNKGHDGFTVHGLWRMLDYDCIEKRPNILTILIGCNDISVEKSTGKTLEEQCFKETYEKILERICQETKAKIICMAPFIFPYPLEFQNWIPSVRKIEIMVSDLTEKFSASFVALHDMLNASALNLGYEKITTDGIHLTENGARIVAEKWMEAAGF